MAPHLLCILIQESTCAMVPFRNRTLLWVLLHWLCLSPLLLGSQPFFAEPALTILVLPQIMKILASWMPSFFHHTWSTIPHWSPLLCTFINAKLSCTKASTILQPMCVCWTLSETHLHHTHLTGHGILQTQMYYAGARNSRKKLLFDGWHHRHGPALFHCPLPSVLTDTHSQFKPVTVSPDNPVGACKISARLTSCGTILNVDRDGYCFTMFPTQTITASLQPQTLPIQAVLEKSLRWPNPTAWLPLAHNFVAFTGKLAYFKVCPSKFENNVLSRAVVTLDNITYLRTTVSPNHITHLLGPPKPIDADTITLKRHMLKYAQGSTTKKLRMRVWAHHPKWQPVKKNKRATMKRKWL